MLNKFLQNKTLIQLFEKQVHETPDAIAITGDSPTGRCAVTYNLLNREADQLAQYLAAQKISSGDIAGLMAHRSIDMIIGILAILKTGAAYLPLNPKNPRDRTLFMLADSNARILLTTPEARAMAGDFETTIDVIDISQDFYFNHEGHEEKKDIKKKIPASNLAYIIYTSGSTGNPKGVPIKHENLSPLLHWGFEYMGFSPSDRSIQMLSYFFDWSVWEIFITLTTGGSLHMISDETTRNPMEIASFIKRHAITVIHLTPTQLHYLLDASPNFFSMKHLVIGAEKLTPALVKRAISSLPSPPECNIYNMYGPTEGTIITSVQKIDPLKPNQFDHLPSIPIGPPVANNQYLVLDENMNSCPIEQPGELYIIGSGLAEGYLNNPALTTVKFLATDGHRPEAQTYTDKSFYKKNILCQSVYQSVQSVAKILYKTGDKVRWLPDGSVEFLGRIDFQVKIRGYRIELGEIENRIGAVDGVMEAVVVVVENGEKHLCAYYVLVEERCRVPHEIIREQLEKDLPDYMIPSFFVELESLPLNPNGKLDRARLPHPDLSAVSGAIYQAPETGMEKTMVDIWHDVLGITSIGLNDRFFQVGGHSLKAAQLSSAVLERLNVLIPVPEILKDPSVKELVEFLEKGETAAPSPIPPTEEREYYPISSAQEMMFILHQIEEQEVAYNIPLIFRPGSPMEPDRLQPLLQALVDRHEALRTSFHIINGRPVQRIHSRVTFTLETTTAESEETAVDKFIRTFDLSRPPLFRAALTRLDSGHQLFLLDMHHIISDKQTVENLFNDLQRLSLGEQLPPLPPLPVRYRDYSLWQQKRKETDLAVQERFWLSQLDGELPDHRLPLDFQRNRKDSRGRTVYFEIPTAEADALRRMAQNHGTTLHRIFLAIYNVFISKICGQEDIIIGSPVAGRRHPDLAQIAGMFVNSMALRNSPAPHKTFLSFLEEVKHRTLEALENQDYPFDDLMDKLHIQRDPVRNPLFDVLFAVNTYDAAPPTGKDTGDVDRDNHLLEGIALEAENLILRSAKVDLTFTVHEWTPPSTRLNFTLEYSIALYTPQTIGRMVNWLKHLITQIAESPNTTLGDLELITEQEKQEILEVFNNTKTDYPKDESIYILFKTQAKRQPDAVAIREYFPGNNDVLHITYSELDRKASLLSAEITGDNPGPHPIIAIAGERSLKMVTGILAILKTGAAYLPIDPNYPEDRINYILNDSGTKLLLTTPGNAIALRIKPQISLITQIEKKENTGAALSVNSVESVVKYNDPAYVMYTSGTTGKPKGVLVTHRNVIRLVKNTNFVPLNNETRILQTGASVFDVATFEMWGSLLNGGQLVLTNNDVILDAKKMGTALLNFDINTLWLTSALLNQLSETGTGLFAPLTYLLAGGDVLSPIHINRIRAQHPELTVINGYGPTENATFSTTYTITKTHPHNIPIGRPIANSTAYILDNCFNLLPPLIPGELYVGGDGLAEGYLNNPALTAERFFDWDMHGFRGDSHGFFRHGYHRLSRISTEGFISKEKDADLSFPMSYELRASSYLYQTGDMARWLLDGNIEFIGRIDSQVKIRGFRVELGEIEERMLVFPGVESAVVVVSPGENELLCGFFVVRDNETVVSEKLREFLQKELPDYMVPSCFMEIDEMPLTVNGKIDKKKLPVPKGFEIDEIKKELPVTVVEKKLAELWQHVLGIDVIGRNDHFFRLGGHSLKAIGLNALIQKHFNVDVPVSRIFQHSFLRDMAKYITGARSSRYMDIHPVEDREYYPMSSAQKRMFMLNRLQEQNVFYNIPVVLEIGFPLETGKTRDVFNTLIDRHESLRTSFHLLDGQPVQKIHEPGHIEFPIEDYDSFSTRAFPRPFDLSAAPLIRAALGKDPDGGQLLAIDMHHIIADKISLDNILNEFVIIYNELHEGASLPLLPVQYRDFTLWQEQMKTGFLSMQEQYWLERLSGDLPVLALPFDFPRPAVRDFNGGTVSFDIDEENVRALDSLALSENASLYMVMLAVFNIVLSRWSGQEDIIVGSPTAGRNHHLLEPLIGMFVNTMALRNFPKYEKTFREFLADVRDGALQTFENQDYQFEDIVDRLAINRDAGRNPLFDVVFSFNKDTLQASGDTVSPGQSGSNSGSIKLKEWDLENPPAKFDLTFTLEQTTGGKHLKCSIEYATSLFKKETVERMTAHIRETVANVIKHPDNKLGHIDIITPEERKQLLEEFSTGGKTYPVDKTIHELFSQQAERTPDRIALVSETGGCLSYKELNRVTGNIAGALISRGAVPGDIIGILAERSLEMITGIISILKTTSAYLPLNPQNPAERNRYMLADTGAQILLIEPGTKELTKGITGNIKGLDVLDIKEEGKGDRGGKGDRQINVPTSYELRASSFAYIIYTSGSTGQPKGVPIRHSNFCQLIHWGYDNLGIGPSNRAIQNLSYFFDWSVWEIFITLTGGAALFMISGEILLNACAKADFITKHAITVLHLTPTQLHHLLTVGRKLTTLNYLCIGAEKLTLELTKAAFNALGPGSTCRIFNMYGPTEATIISAIQELHAGQLEQYENLSSIPIGPPTGNTKFFILDAYLNPVPINVPGELYIAGDGLAEGYLNNPGLTADKFLFGDSHGFCGDLHGFFRHGYHGLTRIDTESFILKRKLEATGKELVSFPMSYELRATSYFYKTGDNVRWLPGGVVEFLGRVDFQVKVRGYRIELGEIERRLLDIDGVRDAIVMVVKGDNLCGYYVSDERLNVAEIRGVLENDLPSYMIPGFFVHLDSLPLNANGKVDRKRLPEPEGDIDTGVEYVEPSDNLEQQLLEIWQEVLGIERIGIHDNLFALGGNSFMLLKIQSKIDHLYPKTIKAVDIFTYPTIHKLSEFINSKQTKQHPKGTQPTLYKSFVGSKGGFSKEPLAAGGIAIVGLSLKITDTEDAGVFWRYLVEGRDLVGEIPFERRLGVESLLGVSKDGYEVSAYLDEIDKFDNGFFKLSPREAALMDPNQRLFLQAAWRAMEDGGYGGDKLKGSNTGVFVGYSAEKENYINLVALHAPEGQGMALAGNLKSVLAGRISYMLDFSGPALVVDTACSSGLVALHTACRAIQYGECDQALAGSVKIKLTPVVQPLENEEIISSDGRTHTFDDASDGTGTGEGVIALLLKTVERAVEDGDRIYAVLKGGAVNQDGSSIGLTAPNAAAQANVIDQAWKVAAIDPLTISYIEAHGTGTKLGDPIEIEGITRAFSRYTNNKKFCAVGSVKTNIGHLDHAAGLAGVVKAVLALNHKKIPPLVHFKTPNRHIDFENSPVYINKECIDWEWENGPRRCGVSSFGLSGTNCHIVLEEAPERETQIDETGRERLFLFTISARTPRALRDLADAYREFFNTSLPVPFKDLCYTANTGRGHYNCRLVFISSGVGQLKRQLESTTEWAFDNRHSIVGDSCYYGQFRIVPLNKKTREANETNEELIKEKSTAAAAAISQLKKTPAENQLEHIAALYCEGGLVDWEEFHKAYGITYQKTGLPVYRFERHSCWLKPSETPSFFPYSGTGIDAALLDYRIADTYSHEIYTTQFGPDSHWVLGEHRVNGTPTMVGTGYPELLMEVWHLHYPGMPVEIRDMTITAPLTVPEGEKREVQTVVEIEPDRLTVSVVSRTGDRTGPRSKRWMQHVNGHLLPLNDPPGGKVDIDEIKQSLPDEHQHIRQPDTEDDQPAGGGSIRVSSRWHCLKSYHSSGRGDLFLGYLELPGRYADDLVAFHLHPPLMDAALHFAFDKLKIHTLYLPLAVRRALIYGKTPRKLYSLVHLKNRTADEIDNPEILAFDIRLLSETGEVLAIFEDYTMKRARQAAKEKPLTKFFHDTRWVGEPLDNTGARPGLNGEPVLVFKTGTGFADALARVFNENGAVVTEAGFPADNDFFSLLQQTDSKAFARIIYPFDGPPTRTPGELDHAVERGVLGLYRLTRALLDLEIPAAEIVVVVRHAWQVTGNKSDNETFIQPEAAALAGLAKVIPQEYPHLKCRSIDIGNDAEPDHVVREILAGSPVIQSAYRDNIRYIEELYPVTGDIHEEKVDIKENGVYVVTGGLGGIGLELSKFLASGHPVKLALLNRSQFPSRDSWNNIKVNKKDNKDNERVLEKIEAIRSIEANGSHVSCYAVDVSDHEKLSAVLHRVRRELGPIDGVIHSAGISTGGLMVTKDEKAFMDVLAPKIKGTWLLDHLTRDDQPDFFVMCSSLTALTGAPGSGDYTAANCYQDAFAYYRRGNEGKDGGKDGDKDGDKDGGKKTLSINWCAWKETGMAKDYGVNKDGLFKTISNRDGVEAFGFLLNTAAPRIMVGQLDASLLDSDDVYLPVRVSAELKQTQPAAPVPGKPELPETRLEGKPGNDYSSTERKVAAAWSSVLGFESVNIFDNYYDIGGDSINALGIVNLINKTMGINITVVDIFAQLTVQALAASIDEKYGSGTTAEEEPHSRIEPVKESAFYPVSAAQRRLFFIDRIAPGTTGYNLPLIREISGPLDIKRLESAFSRMIERHEPLRTSFILKDNAPVQVIHPHGKIPVRLKVNEASPGEAAPLIRDFVRPFDIGRAPLVRMELIKTGEEKHLLALDFHHIAADAMACNVFLHELAALYSGQTLPPLPVRYRDFAAWQNNLFDSSQIKKQGEYWLDRFRGTIPVLQLPTDFPRPPVQNVEGAVAEAKLSPEQTEQARIFAREHKVTLYMLVLTAYYIILHRYSGQEDIVIGSASSGRSHPDLENMVGMFVNILALRNFPAADKKITGFMNEVKTSALDAFENQDYPFDQLVEELDLERDMSRSPLVDVTFSYMSFENSAIADKPLEMGDAVLLPYEEEEKESSKSDMTLFCTETDSLIFAFEYCTALFSPDYMEQFARHLIRIINIMTQDPVDGAPPLTIGQTDFLSDHEKQRILEQFNMTREDYPRDRSFVQMFRQQAARIPDSQAIVGQDTGGTGPVTVTYRFLDAWSGNLAAQIKKQGGGPGGITAIMTKQTPSMIAAILAILKTGAAYLPIDPALPKERIEFMLKDSAARLILVDSVTEAKEKITLQAIDMMDISHTDSPPVSPAFPGPNDAAYVIYTSGTSGQPKGVMIEHRSLMNLCAWRTRLHSYTERDRHTKYLGIGFDVSVVEIFPTLYAGASIYIVPHEIKLEITQFNRFLETYDITISSLPTQVAEIFMQHENHSLRLLFTGGDRLRKFTPRNYVFVNEYGPTEYTVDATYYQVKRQTGTIPIGKPLANTSVFILDKYQNLQPIRVPGELYISGHGMARGYLNRPELTAERFILAHSSWLVARREEKEKKLTGINEPSFPTSYELRATSYLYKTGDSVRWLPDGNIEFLGRIDTQVKIRGYRVELGEIENILLGHHAVREVVVLAVSDSDNQSEDFYLRAFYVPCGDVGADELKTLLLAKLPDYMVPAVFSVLEKMPVTANGKPDRRALAKMKTEEDARREEAAAPPANQIEKMVAEAWKEVLHKTSIGVHDNFFQLGGNSLLIIKLSALLAQRFGRDIPVMTLFRFPTIHKLAAHLEVELDIKTAPKPAQEPAIQPDPIAAAAPSRREIAVIGMACRFPGANNIDEFRFNLENGIESISFFTPEQLDNLGVSPELRADPNFVNSGGVIDNFEEFDARFFGYTPLEATVMDPQVRIFHECVYEALENAGYFPGAYNGSIGLFAGASSSHYWTDYIYQTQDAQALGLFSAANFADRDFMCSRVSYNLNLKGPAFTIQTACSTSLTAIHEAVNALRSGQCNIVLAGGVSALGFVRFGYLYKEGMIQSSDGHCRAFDARADGTVFGSGAGAVVLKPLDNALADRDHIYALIKGSAINNDGNRKVGYTAPSIEGQAEVIRAALQDADVEPATVSYVETHGTGTALGDPVEMEALGLAFKTNNKNSCGIGSVKTNIGHLDAAAGAAGFIKTVLALYYRFIPPTLNFSTPNPRIDFENSPFYVNTRSKEWKSSGHPLRAGVSSFGIGGTNAHVVLEEARSSKLIAGRERREEEEARSSKLIARREEEKGDRQKNHVRTRFIASTSAQWPKEKPNHHLLLLSAKTASALDAASRNLHDYLSTNPGLDLGDAAFTLAVGRGVYNHRQALVCPDVNEAVERLAAEPGQNPQAEKFESGGETRTPVFMFPGQGAQYVNMGRGLYESETVFREAADQCFEILEPLMGIHLKEFYYPGPREQDADALRQTRVTQPVIFVIQYAVSRLLMHWGILPKAMTGHSIGEYAAAHLAGVMSLQDALAVVVKRGQLMQGLPPGSMLSAPLPQEQLTPLLDRHPGVSLAAVNSTGRCVVSGPTRHIEAFKKDLEAKGHDTRLLHTSHAFHSAMMDPVLDEFQHFVARITLNKPKLPYISNVTGTWITSEQAQDPAYYAAHLRGTVRFADGTAELAKLDNPVFIEIGPGNVLSTFTRKHDALEPQSRRFVLNLVRHPGEEIGDHRFLLQQIGKLWLYGAGPDWEIFYKNKETYRVPLPTYPFQRQHFAAGPAAAPSPAPGHRETAPTAETAPPDVPAQPVPRLTDKSTGGRLVEIWKRFLGHDTIAENDNFFDLGGDSLLAVRIVSAINDEFGTNLLSHMLLKYNTIASLSTVIDEKTPENPVPGSLVSIQSGNPDRTPLFLVHPIGGNVYFYRHLAESLGAAQPVFGLKARGLEDGAEPRDNITEMAAAYIEDIRTLQPRGPYYLGGASFGGTVVFEMAQQLLESRDQVELLFMIDTPGPGHMPPEFQDRESILAYYLNAGANAQNGFPPVSPRDIRGMDDNQLRELLLERGGLDEYHNPGTILEQTKALLRVFEANYKAMAAYYPETYPGSLLFFRAMEETPVNAKNPEYAWIGKAGQGVLIVDVPGDHISMNLPPNIGTIGNKINSLIGK